ncbi:hypothetical protein F5B21DRAFT_504543 [Xylaria acuta]|nr:hypothetical protein F5B21DRAFT_504543 [Xylaria acuta]
MADSNEKAAAKPLSENEHVERSQALDDDIAAIVAYFLPDPDSPTASDQNSHHVVLRGIRATSLAIRRQQRVLREANTISSIGSVAPRHGSLADTVEIFIKPSVDFATVLRCLENLLRLLRFAGTNSIHKTAVLLKSLDAAQKHVMTLLEEWWTGRSGCPTNVLVKTYLFGYALAYEGDETYDRASRIIEELAPAEDLKLFGTVRGQFDNCNGAIYEAIMTDDANLKPGQRYMNLIEQASLYDDEMFRLFLNDLDSTRVDPKQSGYRHDVRKFASEKATATRIGYACFRYVEPYLKSKDQLHETASNSDDRVMIRDVGRIIPTTAEPCPWLREHLSNSDQRSSFPYYLWHVGNRCTVRVADVLESQIEYAIISHTWGRWKEEGPGARIPGVPWLVPRNSLFDVEKLPPILESAGFFEPYIWMDLLCIPQEESVEWQVKICKLELPRQATIFQKAATAVAWLHDVSHWSGMRWAILWYGLSFLKISHCKALEGSDTLGRAIDVAEKRSSGPAELLKTATDKSGVLQRTPSGWLSSLWTLQESVIRPDMLLLDSNFQPIFSRNAMAITVDSLITLQARNAVDSMSESYPLSTNLYPRGAREIRDCLRGILNLNDISRFSTLIMGRTRTCSHSRAAAIMSVTGATDWFEGRTLEQFRGSADTDRMIFGLYPWEFVNEVYKKSGPSFFSCWITKATLRTTWDEQNCAEVVHTLRGTMLPFLSDDDELTGASIIPDPWFYLLESHKSTESWVINVNGSVLLPTVGVITSNSTANDRTHGPLECGIFGNDPQNHQNEEIVKKMGTDLISWVQGFRGEAYAICTMYSALTMKGIVLHRLDSHVPFVKAAVFSTIVGRKFDVPEPMEVQWVVQ